MYIMSLADGTQVEFSGLNGTNLIVPDKKEMDVSVFTDENLKSCSFKNDEGTETEVKNLSFIQQQKQADGDFYICFYEKSEQEIAMDEIKDLLVQVAKADVESGSLEMDDIEEGSLKNSIKAKMDADKKLEL